ncbi:MAG: hypothetical protein ACRC5W_03600 [Cetobacterium sp.]|uniref:hypothetical protein n=1 Tax=Cetobacterium sp. TaxID=2071632 RepID=UPI003F3B47CF
MKSKFFFKIIIIVLTIVLSYYLYNQIIILKSEYIKRENQKKIFLEKIEETYKQRNEDFYKQK